MTSFSSPRLNWEASPLRALFGLAWPIVVSMLSVSTMTLMDTLFVSRLGSAAVAGVGLAGVLTFTLWCFPMGALRAVKILVSHSAGAGNREGFRPLLGAALALSALLGAIVCTIGLLVAPALVQVTATVESGTLAGDYLSVRVLCSAVFLALISIQETRQGFGDSRTMMFTTLFGNLLNIALDYWFIFGLGWGVEGAAWASNVALSCEFLALATVHVWRDGLGIFSATRAHFRNLVRFGIPSGIQFGMEVASFGVMTLILASYSELHTAAHQICIQVLHFSFLPAMAIGEAGSVLVGQALGARRSELVGTITRLTLWLALAYASICGLVLFFGAEWIVGRFTSEQALAHLAVNLFLVLAVFQLFDAANIVARSLLRGTGDVHFVAIAGIASAWLCTPPLTYFLGKQLGWGVYGAWVGICSEILIVNVVLWTRLNAGSWRRVAAVPVLD